METSMQRVIRTFQRSDLPACLVLYREGLIGGQIAENDTGLDMDDIESAYLHVDGNHFWVAQLVEPDGSLGSVVGMIGVQHFDGVAQIRRLRVTQAYRRRGIGTELVETALEYCRDRGYLQVTLDTFIERDPAIQLFEKFRFRLNRARTIGGREMLYFYLDLYTGAPHPHKGDAGKWSVSSAT
jgi:ribosomal protein S18 acetylase RimI-like enzyme